MTDNNFDLVVIGGGPGGYVAAIRAAQLGMKAAVIEREHLGGICLNWGCIPTKSLLRSGEVFHTLNHLDQFGLSADNIQFDLEKVVNRSRQASKQLAAGVRHLLKKNKVQVIEGHGRLLGDGKISVMDADENETKVSANHIIIAAGARAKTLPHIQPTQDKIWTYREAMVPNARPDRLLVIGSGAIGIEFASFYNAMGSDVTVVELVDRILPAEDAEISQLALKSFEKQGITIHTKTTAESVDTDGDGVTVTLKDHDSDEERKIEVDRVILAIGITGNIEDLGLDNTAIETDRGHIVTDEYARTAEDNIYAIGDITGAPWLAHKASHEGILAVEHIAGRDNVHPMNTDAIPGCTYCHPQVASIGMTEGEAEQAGRAVKIGRFPFIANGKAIAMGETEGLVKTIFDEKTGELLGAHMFGAEVTELIQGYAIAMKLETTEAELMETIFPHPTISEGMHESVLDAFDRVIHY
jgi:dihydrolipoamide dehydrogenase